MTSISIKLDNCKNTNDNYNLSQPIILDSNKNYKAALSYFCSWNNIHNITKDNNIFKYSNDNGKTWKTITLIHGAYDLIDLNLEIHRYMLKNEDFHYDKQSKLLIQ